MLQITDDKSKIICFGVVSKLPILNMVSLQMDAKLLGKGAATVTRDRTGKKRNMDTEEDEDEETRVRKAAQQEQYQQWGKG